MLAALLLAAVVRAQDGGAPPQDDVLDWLTSTPTAPQPDPETPPAQEPQTPKAPEAAAPNAPAARGSQANPGFPAALACAEALRRALTLEVQVQDYEASTDLGREEHPESLQGYRKQRWDRMQKDKAEFRQKAGQVPLKPLEIPRPKANASLSREALALLPALQRGYDSTRATPPIEQYIEMNNAFIKSGDWAQRDRAVVLRDEIVEREVVLGRLIQDAAKVVTGEGGDELVSSMSTDLDRVAPEARAGGDDLAVLVLHDEGLRQQVMAEVTSILTHMPPPPPPPGADAELRPKVAELRTHLVEGDLAAVISEHDACREKIAAIDAQLKLDMPIERRKELVGRRTPVVAQANELEQRWYGTPPDPETFGALVAAQDELIRRRLLDLGPAGVLYGQRAAALQATRDAGFEAPIEQWHFVEQQDGLLALLDGVKPTENPLLGVTLPDLLGQRLMEDAQVRVAEANKLLAKSAAMPTKNKKGPQKAGPKSGQHQQPKAKPKPKPKPQMKKPQGKKGKKGKKPY